jgi:hypothetical protein
VPLDVLVPLAPALGLGGSRGAFHHQPPQHPNHLLRRIALLPPPRREHRERLVKSCAREQLRDEGVALNSVGSCATALNMPWIELTDRGAERFDLEAALRVPLKYSEKRPETTEYLSPN